MSREETDRAEPTDAPAIAEALFRGGSAAGQPSEQGPAGGRSSVRAPEDLEHVGPATATVIESAPFDAAAIAAKSVSYRELLEAGVDQTVADRLRRTYSLVWSFAWRIGDGDLRRRAERVGGLGAPERRWIAESAGGVPDRIETAVSGDGPTETAKEPHPEDAEDAPRADDGAPEKEEKEEHTRCGRCGGELSTYALGVKRTVRCEACGYVGVPRGPSG